ncbi:putative cytochrome p450 monooxygenase protein [Neofusicoccum parvum]|uniref:Cytochrome p450 monooxygenase protein n=1 Tax=Neofusicoccum parvum TaxID=310453 RepID=A0ACB5RS51_9PEZI|nr:putative cytochrome p450 monooxygenase protein [Neofusicoccum parvum]GME36322.1 putative cytochrome p450 monooxygenase protein [Neofusicoccum parvum]
MSILRILLACFGSATLYLLSKILYNILLHPLRRYPGPLTHAATRIPYCAHLCAGRLPFHIHALHARYGPIVRIAPDELSISGAGSAWKDIMGHQHGARELGKWRHFYAPVPRLADAHIVAAPREEHARLRRAMAHGFSDAAMRAQEPLIARYIDLLVRRLRENAVDAAGGRKTLDIMAWYNFTTFDVIGDLAFGEAFGCLERSDYHPWVKAMFDMAKGGVVMQSASFFPGLTELLLGLLPEKAKRAREEHQLLTRAKLERRIALGKDRPDLIEGLLKKKDEWGLGMEKLQANAGALIIAGSETTATLLSGVTYLLLKNPAALEKLTEEVRSTFKSEDEISINSVGHLKYMLACLDEALRMYPPTPSGLPRVVPQGGVNIVGNFVPENTVVAIHMWATYHDETNFTKPFEFHPERHLGDPRFAADKLEVLQPFHVGPRSCLGRNLAYAEMRTILARVIYNFDMKLAEDSQDWMGKQKIFLLWEKGPLNVYLTPASQK